MSELNACTRAPAGWKCTRGYHKDGPCAAVADRAFAPHCDQSVLHAPGECEHCDVYPEWQEHREVAGIAFTGHAPTARQVSCPSEISRSIDRIYRWGGNVPKDPAG